MKWRSSDDRNLLRDRRQFVDPRYTGPERRSGIERRIGEEWRLVNDRRSGKDRRVASVTFFVTNSSSVPADFHCGFDYAGDNGRPKFIVEWSSRKWVVPPSIRGAVGITGLSGTGSHSETLSEGISIDERCWGL